MTNVNVRSVDLVRSQLCFSIIRMCRLSTVERINWWLNTDFQNGDVSYLSIFVFPRFVSICSCLVCNLSEVAVGKPRAIHGHPSGKLASHRKIRATSPHSFHPVREISWGTHWVNFSIVMLDDGVGGDLEKNSTVLVPQSPPPATARDWPTTPTAGLHLHRWLI